MPFFPQACRVRRGSSWRFVALISRNVCESQGIRARSRIGSDRRRSGPPRAPKIGPALPRSQPSANMFPWRCCLLLISLLLALVPEADSSRFQYSQERQASSVRRYCGRSLSSTLQVLCDGVYNTRFKDSSEEGEVNDEPVIYEFHRFKSPENAKKMLRHRNARGIYEECCVKSCSTSELRAYCGGGLRPS